MPGVRIIDMPDLGTVTDASSFVGEKSGSGRFLAAALRAYVGPLFVTPQMHGAVGDGTTNDSTAFQAAIDDAIATNLDLYIPRVAIGYVIGTTLVVSAPLRIIGGGWSVTGGGANLMPRTISLTTFSITTQGSVLIDGVAFGLTSSVLQTSGCAVLVDPGAGAMNYYSRLERCYFHGQALCISFVRATGFNVEGCTFNENTNDISIENLTANDSGDSTIKGCLFEQDASVGYFSGANVGSAIQQFSAGGLKVIGNKFNGHLYGYVLNLNTPTFSGTSDLIFTGNSLENMPTCGVLIQQSGTSTETYQNVQILGNQISYTRVGVQIIAGGANWIKQIIITDNIIEISKPMALGAITGSGIGINLQTGNYGIIDDNLIFSEGGTVTGISVESPCSGVVVGAKNQIFGCSTAMSVAGTNVAEPVTQSGTITLTTSTAYGALFYSGSGGTAVTFAAPFNTIPRISGTVWTVGGVGLLLISATTTGFVVSGIGIANTTDYTFVWTATG